MRILQMLFLVAFVVNIFFDFLPPFFWANLGKLQRADYDEEKNEWRWDSGGLGRTKKAGNNGKVIQRKYCYRMRVMNSQSIGIIMREFACMHE